MPKKTESDFKRNARGRSAAIMNKYHSFDEGFWLKEEYDQMQNERMRTSPRIPICFCIDVSGSMQTSVGSTESRISLLGKVMKRMLKAMQEDDSALASEAMISVIVYNRHAHRIQPFVDIRSIDLDKATRFYASGQTFMSEALNRALQVIDDKVQELQENDNDSYVPMLVFMTDGEAFSCGDDPTLQFSWVRERVSSEKLHVFPIGISREADMRVLRMMTPTREAYQITTVEQFVSVFDEIRKRAKKKSFGFASEDGMEMTPMVSIEEHTINCAYGLDTAIIDAWDTM